LWPRPTEEELNQYYTELYRQEYHELPIEVRYRTDLDEARIRVRRLLLFLHPNAQLLEIGSGCGAFLIAVHPYAASVVGVEPDAASRDWIERRLGIPVVRQVDMIYESKQFDFVVLFHVLEHIPDPVRFLQSLRPLLRLDGRLIVEVPNVDDALVAVYQVPAYSLSITR